MAKADKTVVRNKLAKADKTLVQKKFAKAGKQKKVTDKTRVLKKPAKAKTQKETDKITMQNLGGAMRLTLRKKPAAAETLNKLNKMEMIFLLLQLGTPPASIVQIDWNEPVFVSSIG